MEKFIINPETLGEAVGPFSRAVRVGNFLFIAGTTALSHLSGDYFERKIPDSIEEQTRLTFENISRTMEAAGGTMKDIFKVVVILKDPAHYKRMNEIRAKFFPTDPPISTCFLANLVRNDILIEVEATAVLREGAG